MINIETILVHPEYGPANFVERTGEFSLKTKVVDSHISRFTFEDGTPVEVADLPPLSEPMTSEPEPMTEEEKALAPYRFEIEETYREEGQRAGDRLVASILRQEGFEPTSPKEQESTRQAVQNEMVGGTSSRAEYEEMARAMEADKESAILDDLASFKVGDTVEFRSKSNVYVGEIAHIEDGEARIVYYGNSYYASVSDLKKV